MIYPQYWIKGGNLETFIEHLGILKFHYCEPRHFMVKSKVKHNVDGWNLRPNKACLKLR